MLEVDDLHVVMGEQPVLRGVSLSIPSKSIVCVLGANGAGKTTLLRTITGIYPAAAGAIMLDGERISGLPSHEIVRRGLGHAPEGRHLFPGMTVEENLRVGAQVRPAREFPRTLEEVLGHFPAIRDKMATPAGALSGGEQQMVCLARSLMARPRIFLLDEPSLGLAPMVVAQIFELITAIRNAGTTIVLVEQNAKAALSIAQYAYVIEGGRISIEGPANTLNQDPRIEAAYLGGVSSGGHRAN
jgi:branched-chain amino acid transport system ATP-binding protein